MIPAHFMIRSLERSIRLCADFFHDSLQILVRSDPFFMADKGRRSGMVYCMCICEYARVD